MVRGGGAGAGGIKNAAAANAMFGSYLMAPLDLCEKTETPLTATTQALGQPKSPDTRRKLMMLPFSGVENTLVHLGLQYACMNS